MNKGGAAGTLGPANMAANAKPDGYTISQLPITVFRLPYMMKTTFDPASDFTYIIGVTGYTFGTVVLAWSSPASPNRSRLRSAQCASSTRWQHLNRS
jgi:tripartite-type tricarboxylate transporter receptor subunit TctC